MELKRRFDFEGAFWGGAFVSNSFLYSFELGISHHVVVHIGFYDSNEPELTDPITTGVDNVVAPPHEPEIAVGISGSTISGDEKLVAVRERLDFIVDLACRAVDVALEDAEEGVFPFLALRFA